MESRNRLLLLTAVCVGTLMLSGCASFRWPWHKDKVEETQTEALPVLSARADPRVVGFLTESYALRRYTQELERRRSAELGEENLFSLGQTPGR